MLIVYVGAVAVLFLFVVMMLNVTEKINKNIVRKGLINNISVGSIVGVIILLELLVVIGGWKYKSNFVPLSKTNLDLDLSNTHALGNILYTDYIHLFQIAGMILLVSMIGAITLTFNKRENIKRQKYFEQIQREKESAISLVDVSTTPQQVWFPAFGDWDSTWSAIWQVNFGNGYFGTTAVSSTNADDAGIGSFEYDVPTGYYALCTKNLATYG